MRHVFLCLLTPSSDIWVSVRFLLPSSSFFFLLSFFLLRLRSHFGSRPFSVKHFALAASAVLCLTSKWLWCNSVRGNCMTTGKKSRTADHPAGIGRRCQMSRALAGSGNRKQHASLRVAAVGSTTIRNAPFVHSVSGHYLGQRQRILQVVEPMCSPCGEDFREQLSRR